MTTWTRQKLGDVCLSITDGKHGDCQNQDNSGFYFISSKDVFNGSVHYENARQITEDDFIETHRRTKLEIGDILITNSGTIGRMALIRSGEKANKTTFQKSVAVLKPNKEKVNNNYLYFLLLSNFKRLVNLGGGAAQHNLLLGDLRNFVLNMPDISTQNRTASILSTYNYLIENSDKRIKILEELAQRLYAEWFVKFKFPGYEKVKMIDSPNGKIPETWEVKKVKDSFKFIGGGTPSRRENTKYWQRGLIDWYTPTDLNNNAMFINSSSEKITEKGLAESSAKLFPEFSVMMTSRATIGRLSINTKPATTNQGFIICIPNQKVPLYFLYLWLKNNIEFFITLGTGATFKEITKGSFGEINLFIPDKKLTMLFQQKLSKLGNEILNLQLQVQNLEKARDLLIPQLVTGRRELKS